MQQLFSSTLSHIKHHIISPCSLLLYKRASGHGLLLLRLHLGSCTIQHFDEVGSLGTHAGVEVRFGAFDVVVEVVAEGVDKVDCVLTHLGVRVSLLEHERDVADVLTTSCIRSCEQPEN